MCACTWCVHGAHGYVRVCACVHAFVSIHRFTCTGFPVQAVPWMDYCGWHGGLWLLRGYFGFRLCGLRNNVYMNGIHVCEHALVCLCVRACVCVCVPPRSSSTILTCPFAVPPDLI